MGSQNLTTDPRWTAHTLQKDPSGTDGKGVLQVSICKDGDLTCSYGTFRAILSSDGTQWLSEAIDGDGNPIVLGTTSQDFLDARDAYLAQVDAEVAALDAAGKITVG